MPQHEVGKKTIDGMEFEVHHLDPVLSLKLLRRLMAAIAPAIGSGIGSADISGVLNQTASVDMGAGLRALFDRLDEKLVEDLRTAFADVSIVDGSPLSKVYAVKFSGRIGTVLEWLVYCALYEWDDIRGKAIGAIARFHARVQALQQSKSPNT